MGANLSPDRAIAADNWRRARWAPAPWAQPQTILAKIAPSRRLALGRVRWWPAAGGSMRIQSRQQLLLEWEPKAICPFGPLSMAATSTTDAGAHEEQRPHWAGETRAIVVRGLEGRARAGPQDQRRLARGAPRVAVGRRPAPAAWRPRRLRAETFNQTQHTSSRALVFLRISNVHLRIWPSA